MSFLARPDAFLRTLTVLACLAVSVLSLAHKPPATADEAAIAFLSGAGEALCGDTEFHPDPGCIVCQLANGGFLPDRAACPQRLLQPVVVRTAVGHLLLAAPRVAFDRSARAPPPAA